MSFSAFPGSPDAALIADASVVIGLNASGQARRIIELTKRRVIVPDNASNELMIGARFGHSDGEQLDALVEAGLVARRGLDSEALIAYEALIDGTYGDTLDDGEAATIALAVRCGGVVVLDEKKARRMCMQHFPQIIQGSTAEWLLSADGLGKAQQAEAMINALRKGRVRVPREFLADVVSLIGADAASTCPSLPRFVRRDAA